MIEPFCTCVGVTSGTKLFDPGTFTRTVPLTGSRLTVLPAIGRGSACGPPAGAATVTVCVCVVVLPEVSVAIALAVNTPGAEYACEAVVPSALELSPKSQCTLTGLLQRSLTVAAKSIAVPGKGRLAAGGASRPGRPGRRPQCRLPCCPWTRRRGRDRTSRQRPPAVAVPRARRRC